MSKPSSIQPRLLPSMIATGLVALFYFTIFAGQFAHAAELDSTLPNDHNHERLLDPFISARGEAEDGADMIYQAEFSGTGEELHGRQVPTPEEIPNNIRRSYNVEQGETKYFVFTNQSLWGPLEPPGSGSSGLPSMGLGRRWERGDEGASETADGGDEESSIHKRANETRSVYITLNTCEQPSKANGGSRSEGPPPQVELYVGENQTTIGPNKPADGQRMVKAEYGFANLTFDASKDIYIALTGPDNSTEFDGLYVVELVASIDMPFHSYNDGAPDLFFIDSDSSSALLATKNLTLDNATSDIYQQWMQLSPPPYVIFANNQNQPWLSGVSHSYCGLERYAQIAGTQKNLRTDMVKTTMTNVTLGGYPKQQFYFQGLNASSQYYGILALPGNTTERAPGGGGRLWQTMNFTTQSG
ncbi:hypothetical protein V493_07310 [Pseudogymnoascus sp. VKM F-4281 (FW-2241)]|nr:hypothetical protein V493_07310 [Pseudogymnoascus sp. VKM F-4281 (FW-2241)]